MAIARAFQPIDMFSETVWFGNLVETSSSRIDIRLGDLRTLYKGDFSYPFGRVAGTLNSVTEWNGSGKYYEITGMTSDAAAYYDAIQVQGNWSLAATIALAKADKVYGSSGNDGIFSWTGNDLVRGYGGDDEIWGGAGADRIFGNSGKDLLKGDGGNDVLRGGSGHDELWGGQKDDLLDGGKGADRMIGEAGRDKFVFQKGYGKDTVADFQDDKDTLLIDDALWSGELTTKRVLTKFASVQDGDVVLDFGRNELTIENFTDVTALADDIRFI